MSDSANKHFQNADLERRERFRIDDAAILEIVSVSQEQANVRSAESFFSQNSSFKLIRELREIDQNNQGALRTVSERYSDVAVYLSALNKKIEAIGSAIAETILPEEQTLESIDLSEGGIGFHYDRRLDEGNIYALKVWFHRALIGVSVFIRIVASNRSIEGGQHISAAFHHLPDIERKTIARHIMTIQAEQQREKKAQVEKE